MNRWVPTRGDRVLQVAGLAVLLVALGLLALLLGDAARTGLPRVSWAFLSGFPSRHAAQAGLLPALAGSAWLLVLTALLAVPVGVGAAIYLEEYGQRTRLATLIEVNTASLAGVPSVIYGLLGLGLFVQALRMDRSLLAAACTLALLVLPIVILSTREALRAVPAQVREASLALGASRWQTIWHQVLPQALPGMTTGVILALSRAIGETAPLIAIGALTFVPFLPDGVWSPFTALPIQIFSWLTRPDPGFRANAAAGILVLLAMLVLSNAAAVWIRDRARRRQVD